MLLLLALAAAPVAPSIASALETDERLELIVVAERCTSPRCLKARAEKERVRLLVFARPEGDGVVVRVYDAERAATLQRAATTKTLADVARALVDKAMGDKARERVIVLDLAAPADEVNYGLFVGGGLAAVGVAALIGGGACGVQSVLLDVSAREANSQRGAFTRYDERDSAALCANLFYGAGLLTGLLGGAIVLQSLGIGTEE